jgi:hypothetical protein
MLLVAGRKMAYSAFALKRSHEFDGNAVFGGSCGDFVAKADGR